MELRPGESRNVLIKVIGNNETGLLQKAEFEFLANSSGSDLVKNNLTVVFSPNHTTILSSSVGTTLMNVGCWRYVNN